MNPKTFSGFILAFTLVLNQPSQTIATYIAYPSLETYFNQVSQAYGPNFFDTAPPGQPVVNSKVSQPVTLTQPSIQDANYYLYFAFAAYCSESSIKNFNCPTCLKAGSDNKVVAFIEEPVYNTRAFVAINHVKQEIVLTFRGSLNLANIVESFYPVPADPEGPEDVRVHKGFYLAAKSLYPMVQAAVKNLTDANPTYKLKVTGHSLGGGEAQITVYLFKVKNVFPTTTEISLFTYGQPRLGNLAFVNYMNTLNMPAARVTNRADAAVHNIPAFLGYYHTSNELFLNNAIRRYCNTSIYEDPTCANSYGPNYNAIDHLFYFDEPISTCIEQDPYAAFLQLIIPFKKLIPFIPSAPTNPFPLFVGPYFLQVLYNLSG